MSILEIRIVFRILRLLVLPLAWIDSRAYMACYVRVLRACGMKLAGIPRYIAPSAYFDELSRITLGDRVVISRDVRLLTHDYSITTAQGAVAAFPPTDLRRNGTIAIADNVFIGLGCIVLPNAKIGPNTIVGAGSVVRGSVAGASVIIGNPARAVMSIQDYACKVQAGEPFWELELDRR